VVRSPGTEVRELAWTVAGASAGSLARHWVEPLGPDSGRSLAATFVLAALAAMLVGFAHVASIRASIKTVFLAVGGAAGSISAVATRAATATPAQSLSGLAAFFSGAIAGVLAGMFIALLAANVQRAERC
jgi:hypothetical protein